MSKFSIKHSHQALAFREVRQFFLLAQSFYRPKTKTSFKRQFSPKSPKVGQKSGQRVQNWPNKNQVSSELLRESTDSVLRAAEGIHQFCPQSYWGNPLVDNFSLWPAEGIHRFCPQSYWGNPSILSSDLLRESINSVIQPTKGIHTSIYFWLPTSEVTKKAQKTDHSISIYSNFWIFDLVSTVWPPDLPKVRWCPYSAAEKCCF